MQRQKADSHRSFLLRCWQEHNPGPDEPPLWRFALREVSVKQRQHAFSSFEQLVDFLRNEILGNEQRKT